MSRSVFLYDKVQTPPVLRAEVSHPCVAGTHALCGAVPCEKNITFSLRVSVSAALCAVTLLLYRDDDAKTLRYSLRLCEREADTETWRITPFPRSAEMRKAAFFSTVTASARPTAKRSADPPTARPTRFSATRADAKHFI